jgi:hypothetical protein
MSYLTDLVALATIAGLIAASVAFRRLLERL